MEVTKATFNLPNDDIAELRRLAEANHTTVTAMLRQAIATQAYINKEIENGSKLLVEKPNGQIRELVPRW